MYSPALQAALDAALARLRAGEPVAIPTETVYGLAADADNPLAVRRVFALKGRPADHPLIVHLPDAAALPQWGHPDPRAEALGAAFWPGPLTLIVQRQPRVIDEVTGGRDTVGLRVPNHPLALALLAGLGGGLAAPSANRFGRISPTTAQHVQEELGPEVTVLDGGPCQVGVESTIVDLSGPQAALLRPGAVSRAQLEALIGPLVLGSKTAAPGTLPGHYAPRTALRLCADPESEAAALRAQGLRVAVLPVLPARELAPRLYAELRRLDAEGVDWLLAGRVDEDGVGAAVNDRLSRAAWGSRIP